MKIFRWLAVVPAAFLGFVLAFALGLVISRVLDSLCPPADFFEGFCSAPWYDHAVGIALAVCAAVAAFLVVLLPSWIAPTHKLAVSWAAYVAGALTTVYVVHDARSLGQLVSPVCAILAGLIGVWVVKRRLAPLSNPQ